MSANGQAFWFVTGSQALYGEQTLAQVRAQAAEVVRGLAGAVPDGLALIDRGVLTTPDAIRRLFLEANADDRCLGVVAWMHTFSPAQMWIAGLLANQKPLLHLHTQFHREIPWSTIDMDFMNLNQAAHGDREFGHVASRFGIRRKVLVGHWQDPSLQVRMKRWMRVAEAWAASRALRLVRFGDTMREVAVTEGDKVEAAAVMGWTVHAHGVGDLAEAVDAVSDRAIEQQLEEYRARYVVDRVAGDPVAWAQVRGQARIEQGLRRILEEGGFTAFTTNFEDLHGLDQLPGLAVQNLMADGFGFGGEGDWKTAGLLRVLKVMAGFEATSFMEDYTYHWVSGEEQILGAHMLEVCPSIAAERGRIEVHPLAIGQRGDPARVVFDGRPGRAVVASLVDLGTRFRLVVNEVEAVAPAHAMPRLPVGRVLWRPYPSLETSAEAWIYAGGAHHTVFSYGVTRDQLEDFADLAEIECIAIGPNASVAEVRRLLSWGEAVWRR